VTLTNLLTGIGPGKSAPFISGVLASQTVTLVKTGTDSIAATDTVSSIHTTSTTFTVTSPSAVNAI
jgi:hypothetical protein